MRVLQVHWAFPPTTGGVESHVADLSAGLAEQGCEVTVLTGERVPENWPGVTVRRTHLLDLTRVRREAEEVSKSYADALREELELVVRQVEPEIVHGHNLHHFIATPALVLDELAARYGFRVHHTFHETWPDLLHDTPVYRRWAGNYAVSRFVQEECAARIGFSPELRPLGIDTAAFRTARPALSKGRVPVILHPARLLPWKGVHISVGMMSLLAERGRPARLVLTDTSRIADWEGELEHYRSQILELIHDLGVTDRVELRAAAYRDMPALYEEADVVVYPTVANEPFGLVPLESMSARRPVVASCCGGIPETLVDGVTGYLVPPEDAELLATRVVSLLDNPESARAMGEAGRRRVTEHFDVRRYIDALLLNYRVASMAK
jgi:glycosyltransferase involved in cell wall biosynthesis